MVGLSAALGFGGIAGGEPGADPAVCGSPPVGALGVVPSGDDIDTAPIGGKASP